MFLPMRAALVAIACALAGCSSSSFVDPCSTTGNFFRVPQLNPVAVVGQAVERVLIHVVNGGCATSPLRIPEVTVTVLDPQNRPVEHRASAPEPGLGADGSQLWVTRVAFTPHAVGNHHLSALFEPAVGRAQLDVEAAEDHSGAPLTELDLAGGCLALERLADGRVLCQQATQLQISRAGSQVQVLDADDFAVGGSTVWLVKGDAVTRWVDDGGSPAKLVQAPAGIGFPTGLPQPATLLATATQAVLVNPVRALRIRFSQGALVSAGAASLSWLSPPLSIAAAPDFSELLVRGAGGLCRLTLGAVLTPECEQAGGVPLGGDVNGVWSLSNTTLSHTRFGATPGAPLKVSSLVLDQRPTFDDTRAHWEKSIALEDSQPGRVLLPAEGNDGIFFEHYPLEGPFRPWASSSTTLRLQDPTGHQRLFSRSP